MFETPIFDQLSREFQQENGRTYESLTKDGPIMLRVPENFTLPLGAEPDGRPVLVSNFEKVRQTFEGASEDIQRLGEIPVVKTLQSAIDVPFHERWLKEDQRASAYERSRQYQQSMIERLFEAPKPTEKEQARIDMKKRPNGYTPKYIIVDEMNELALLHELFGEKIPENAGELEGVKVRVVVPRTMNPFLDPFDSDKMYEFFKAWRDEAYQKFDELHPNCVLTSVDFARHEELGTTRFVVALHGVQVDSEPRGSQYEQDCLELGERVADAFEENRRNDTALAREIVKAQESKSRSAFHYPTAREALSIKTRPEAEIMEDLKDKVRTLIERDPSKASNEDGRNLEARHRETMKRALKDVGEKHDEMVNEFLKNSMKQMQELEEAHPGFVETDMRFETDEDGGIKYVIEGVAPKDPEDAEALRELVKRSKYDPALRELFIPKQPVCYVEADAHGTAHSAPLVTHDPAVTEANVKHPRKPIENVELKEEDN